MKSFFAIQYIVGTKKKNTRKEKRKYKTGGSTGTISVKFWTEVKGWLRYKMTRNIAESFNPLSTNISVHRWIWDSKDPNVT